MSTMANMGRDLQPMKTLTIRLDESDIQEIEAIQEEEHIGTINGVIRHSIRKTRILETLLSQLAGLFTQEWAIDPEKLKELNNKYGFIQTKLF